MISWFRSEPGVGCRHNPAMYMPPGQGQQATLANPAVAAVWTTAAVAGNATHPSGSHPCAQNGTSADRTWAAAKAARWRKNMRLRRLDAPLQAVELPASAH